MGVIHSTWSYSSVLDQDNHELLIESSYHDVEKTAYDM